MARIADVMSLRVLTVTPDETVQLAIARMLEENVGSVAVCEGSRARRASSPSATCCASPARTRSCRSSRSAT